MGENQNLRLTDVGSCIRILQSSRADRRSRIKGVVLHWLTGYNPANPTMADTHQKDQESVSFSVSEAASIVRFLFWKLLAFSLHWKTREAGPGISEEMLETRPRSLPVSEVKRLAFSVIPDPVKLRAKV